MAKKHNFTRFNLAFAAALASLSAGCSLFDQGFSPIQVSEQEATVENRFGEGDGSDGYTAVVPPLGAAMSGDDIAEDHPESYTVVRGDTLWDISGKFLKKPWMWPQVWNANPGIKNPHLIYPGDLIRLTYDANGQPRLEVTRDGEVVNAGDFGQNSNVERLSPRIRSESLTEAIPSIPGDAIRQFLVYPKVVPASELSKAPYVIGFEGEKLVGAVEDEVYAAGRINRDQNTYGIYRQSKKLRDPITKETLGYEVTHVANAKLMIPSNSSKVASTLKIISNKMETIQGDRLMSNTQAPISHHYVPRMPRINGEGRIVSLVDAITQSGRNQVVVLNLGERSGIKVGDVLAIESDGGMVEDQFKNSYTMVKLPNTRTGVVMVFQTFEKVSYALIMESSKPINKNDIVTEI